MEIIQLVGVIGDIVLGRAMCPSWNNESATCNRNWEYSQSCLPNSLHVPSVNLRDCFEVEIKSKQSNASEAFVGKLFRFGEDDKCVRSGSVKFQKYEYDWWLASGVCLHVD
jgi:hypothetical protein